MRKLIEYIESHTRRGECQCGKCFDKGPDRPAPEHSVNVHFFWVSAQNDPTAEDLRTLLEAEYPQIDRLKQGPSYIEMGGALGDQGIALRLIGLGGILKLWTVVTPAMVGITGEDADGMAGAGFVMAGGMTAEGAATPAQRETKEGS